MAVPIPLLIEAVITETERPALVATVELLQASLSSASGANWPVKARAHSSVASVGSQSPFVAVLSLLPYAASPEPMAQVEARLRREIALLNEKSAAGVFLCTIFRVVSNKALAEKNPAKPPSVERIRRLNLLATELSCDLGTYVADLDRIFAYLGARLLRTDYRLVGRLAPAAAAHSIAAAILAAGLDDLIPPEIQEQAKRFQGDVAALVRAGARRLSEAESAQTHGAR
jgi:hypothetical protein